MMRLTRSFALAAMLCALSPLARANNDIFPPLPAAAKAINFDGHGFLINGKRTWIASGSLHYSRVPRALWRERLLQMKRGGFNTVQTYVFWNIHEPTEGRFDFSGEKDLAAFLDLVHDLGMYAVVRVGPYVCAEWENGGYPNWLRTKPGLLVRADNPQFLHSVDALYDHVLPIVAAHQIHRGGAVIMVQLENEHPNGWGTTMNPYFQHLLDKARQNGIEVPTFFSGLHHGSDPAPRKPEDASKRKSPWYTTEYWTGWYDLYGELPAHNPSKNNRNVQAFDRGTWRILENGGNGYNYYMLHGGTNFGVYGDNEEGASYDYATSIGEAGDLRALYYAEKRTNSFARSFEAILEDSDDSTAQNGDFLKGPSEVHLTARTGPAGTTLFLDNAGSAETTAQLSDGSKVRLRPGEVAGFVRDVRLSDQFTLALSGTRMYGIVAQDNTTTLIVDGEDGESGALHIQVATPPRSLPDGWTAEGDGRVRLDLKFHAGTPAEYRLSSGNGTLRILAMTRHQADRTWSVESGPQTYIVSGPDYLGDTAMQNGMLTATVESPAEGRRFDQPAVVYGPSGDAVALHAKFSGTRPAAPKLAPWQTTSAAAEAAVDFDDSTWQSGDVRDWSDDGTDDGYGWYRTTFTVPRDGHYWLQSLNVADEAQVFVNGKLVSRDGVGGNKPLSLEVQAHIGTNTLAILAWHYGRTKYYPYIGPLLGMDPKGVRGPVTLAEEPLKIEPLLKWQGFGMAEHPAPGAKPDWVAVNGTGELIHLPHMDGNHRGPVRYATQLPDVAGSDRRLVLEGIFNSGQVLLNGKLLATAGPEPQVIPLDSAWSETGPNVLSVVVMQNEQADGVMGRSYLVSGKPLTVLDQWRIHSGIDLASSGSAGGATISRTTFDYTPDPSHRTVLRFSSKGLSRGLVWLNGICVGRYPQKIPVDGTLLPEPWLKSGRNELLIVDDHGLPPGGARIVIEQAASREVTKLER